MDETTTDPTPPLSRRVARLTEQVLRPSSDTLVDRAFAYDRAFAATRGANMVWRKANALADMVLTHRVEINDDELLVGRDQHCSTHWLRIQCGRQFHRVVQEPVRRGVE